MGISGVLGLAQAPSPNKEVAAETGGTPPRSGPADYQARAQAGKYTIAADFTGHTINTLTSNFTNAEYVVVEVAAYGPAGERLTISLDDFSLRLNGNKKVIGTQPFSFLLPELRDPEWEANIPQPDEKKGKKKQQTSEDLTAPPPPPPVYPIEIRREMAERLRKLQLPLGERALPQSGLIFFQYGGRPEKLKSIELLYKGAASGATLSFRP